MQIIISVENIANSLLNASDWSRSVLQEKVFAENMALIFSVSLPKYNIILFVSAVAEVRQQFSYTQVIKLLLYVLLMMTVIFSCFAE